MPEPVHLPQETSPLDILVAGVDALSQRAVASEESPRDEQRPEVQNNLAGGGEPARSISPDEEIVAIFGEDSANVEK